MLCIDTISIVIFDISPIDQRIEKSKAQINQNQTLSKRTIKGTKLSQHTVLVLAAVTNTQHTLTQQRV